METIVESISIVIKIIAAIVVIYGVAHATFLFISDAFKKYHGNITLNIDHIRLVFGRYIILGLEFFIAADILETIFLPTREEMITLAGLVVLRTILNFFLTKELDKLSDAERKKLK